MIPRPGASVYAWAKTDILLQFTSSRKGIFPFILGWQYGEGYTWCIGTPSSLYFWSHYTDFGPDVYFSMVLHSTGRGLPEDVVVVNKLKKRFYEYDEKKGFIISMVEFVEKFGANTNPLMTKVIAMDDTWGKARSLYIGQDYDGSWSLFDQLLADISGFQEEAIKLKNNALFWVYLSEWCIITGTSILAGFFLWTLMVKRKYYKQIDQTRLRPPPIEAGSVQIRCRDDNRPWWKKGELSRLFMIRLSRLRGFIS
jgi:hypothetical protein